MDLWITLRSARFSLAASQVDQLSTYLLRLSALTKAHSTEATNAQVLAVPTLAIAPLTSDGNGCLMLDALFSPPDTNAGVLLATDTALPANAARWFRQLALLAVDEHAPILVLILATAAPTNHAQFVPPVVDLMDLPLASASDIGLMESIT